MRRLRVSLAGHARGARSIGTGRTPRFQVCLPLGYYVNSTGAWWTGVTRTVSRSAVEFVPSDRSTRVGDVLQYVLVFPGSASRVGAVALCRGQVIRAAAAVVVTLDQHHWQSATDVRTAHCDARKRWLVDLCEAAANSLRAAGSASQVQLDPEGATRFVHASGRHEARHPGASVADELGVGRVE